MWKNIKRLYLFACENGLRIPLAYDAASKAPSVTLLFAYITFIIACISVIANHVYDGLFVATATSVCFWVIAYVIYRMRKLDKMKINLEEKSIELDGEDKENTNSEEEENK
jgi:amino acid permease